MGAVALAARFALAAAFAWSAVAKLRRPAANAAALAAFGVPRPGLVARLLPPVEAGVAVALVAVANGAWPAFMAIGVLTFFTAAVVANLTSGRTAPCPCFDPDSARPVSAATVARNGALMAVGVLATGSPTGADPLPTVALALVAVPLTILLLRRFG